MGYVNSLEINLYVFCPNLVSHASPSREKHQQATLGKSPVNIGPSEWLAQCRSRSPYSWNWWRNKRFPIGPPLPSKPQQLIPFPFFRGLLKSLKHYRWDCQICWVPARIHWEKLLRQYCTKKLQWFHTKHLASARSAPFLNAFSTQMLHARLRLKEISWRFRQSLGLANGLASVHWSSLISLDEHPSHKQPLITRLQGLPPELIPKCASKWSCVTCPRCNFKSGWPWVDERKAML